jgi:hypothetical protein
VCFSSTPENGLDVFESVITFRGSVSSVHTLPHTSANSPLPDTFIGKVTAEKKPAVKKQLNYVITFNSEAHAIHLTFNKIHFNISFHVEKAFHFPGSNVRK